MHCTTSVCFSCMKTGRGNLICSSCGKEMVSLYYKLRVPKKKRKLWDKFYNWLVGGGNPYYINRCSESRYGLKKYR